jgi:hypothetical protein
MSECIFDRESVWDLVWSEVHKAHKKAVLGDHAARFVLPDGTLASIQVDGCDHLATVGIAVVVDPYRSLSLDDPSPFLDRAASLADLSHGYLSPDAVAAFRTATPIRTEGSLSYTDGADTWPTLLTVTRHESVVVIELAHTID